MAKTTAAPSLSELNRWLGEIPPSMRTNAKGDGLDEISVRAVVHDLHETLCGVPPAADLLHAMTPKKLDRVQANRLGWTLRLCWLLWQGELRSQPVEAAPLRKLLTIELPQVAKLVAVDALDSEADRREELIRRCLRALGRRLPGESKKQAAARLAQVNSVEANRLIEQAEGRAERAREVREAFVRKAAAEAAAKVSRE